MKYLFCFLMLFGFSNLYSELVANTSLDSNYCKDDSIFTVKIKVVDDQMLPLKDAYITIVSLDNFDKKTHIGDTDKNGGFSFIFNKNENYGYIYISYI